MARNGRGRRVVQRCEVFRSNAYVEAHANEVKAFTVIDDFDRDELAARKLLTGRAELDKVEARYQHLVAKYGGNRHGRRRARAEASKKR